MSVLKQGVARAISQVRQYVGTIEKGADGHHSIVRRKGDTVKFVVNHLDFPGSTFPSLDEIGRAGFGSDILGDINAISNQPMTFGMKPEAHPDNSPAISSYRVNLIPGGFIFNQQTHHYANGVQGFAGFMEQLAENCYAIAHGTEFPSFDPRCLDRSLFTSLGFEKADDTSSEPPQAPSKAQLHAPPAPYDGRPQNMALQSLLFHLPKSKAARLKAVVSPGDGTWISTYNAVCALIWRVFSRIREPVYKPGLSYKPIFGTGVSITKKFTDPPMPPRMQGNLQFDITSATAALPQLTVGEIVKDAPLSQLASYTRQLTEGVTMDMLAARLQKVAHMRNKQELSIEVAAFPLMALYITDWRGCALCEHDYGFGRAVGYRHLFGMVPPGHCIVYPPRRGPRGDDEGMELQVTFEEELVPQLLSDPEWSEYFEFRGVDLWEEGSARRHRAKL